MFRAALLDGIPRDIAAVADYEAYARRRLDDNAWAYLDGAAGDELTRGWNRAAFDRQPLLPRVMNDVAIKVMFNNNNSISTFNQLV